MAGRIELVFFHDILCSWCYIVEKRLEALREEYGDALDLRVKAYPLRPADTAPNQKEIEVLARHYQRAAREPEGAKVVPDLWLSGDPPRSTLPPLLAAEAARQQSVVLRDALVRRLREAAFEQGLNVTRSDILLELASTVGLDMDRFSRGLRSADTAKLVLAEQEEALGHGIRGVPAVIIGGEWLLSGARTLDEYRSALRRYQEKQGGRLGDRLLH